MRDELLVAESHLFRRLFNTCYSRSIELGRVVAPNVAVLGNFKLLPGRNTMDELFNFSRHVL